MSFTCRSTLSFGCRSSCHCAGATVISRLEQIGYDSLTALREQDAARVTKEISEMMGSTCWHNSPQARSAIQAIIDLAKRGAIS
ncbi:hypothetical protein Ple7327_2752 [Pleurocapsa sp. PCC 7327]|nr:hypothetical protein Ple7327_2752 [Pleurocapsa sp. PCC 7327]